MILVLGFKESLMSVNMLSFKYEKDVLHSSYPRYYCIKEKLSIRKCYFYFGHVKKQTREGDVRVWR